MGNENWGGLLDQRALNQFKSSVFVKSKIFKSGGGMWGEGEIVDQHCYWRLHSDCNENCSRVK